VGQLLQKKKSPRVLTIILNWQQPDVTIECVRSVEAMGGTDILLVDNGSADESVARFRAELPAIELMALPENGGFAVGNNAGILHALQNNYDYALVLNNDAFPALDMLTHLLAETAPDIALLSPKIYYEPDPQRIWFTGGRMSPNLLEMRDSGIGELDSEKWQQSHNTDYLLGTGLLVNLAIVEKVGLIDERFFMYYEDLDWSLRLRQAGYRLRLVASAHLYHRVSLSAGGRDSPFQRYHLSRSSVLFFTRHAHMGVWWQILLYRFGSAVKKVTVFTLTGQWRTTIAYLRGLRDGWRLIE
jgi:GT2 family glycosyltransferase